MNVESQGLSREYGVGLSKRARCWTCQLGSNGGCKTVRSKMCRLKATIDSLLKVCVAFALTAFPFAASAQVAPDAALDFGGQIEPVDGGAPDGEDATTEGVSEDDDGFADLSLEELMQVQVVVTASRREQNISTVPYAISVITAADIRAAGARSVPDALRLVSGVDVSDLAYGAAAVSPRGTHGFLVRSTLVLVDGRQIFDSHFGGTLWNNWPFQLEDIERIEVIRGPGGVTWGANAVNGVINIITKDPADQLGLTLTSSGASRGSFKQHIGYGVKEGKWRLRLSGEYEASDGFNVGGSVWRRLDDEYKGGRISLRALYDAGPDDRFTFSAGNAVVDGAFPPTPMAGFGVRRNSGSQASFIMGTWSHDTAKDDLFEVTAYVNDFQVSPGVPAIDYRYQQFALQIRHSYAPANAHRLTWGTDSRVDLLDATNSDPFMLSRDSLTTAIIGLYIQDQWRFAPKWSLDLGARIDYECYGGFEPSARAALSYELSENAMIYGAVSRAFQMPPVGLRFLDLPLINGITRAKGRRDLGTDPLMAYELGYRGRLFDRVDTSLNLFWHEQTDRTTLSPMLGPPGLLRMDLDNRARMSTYGVELDAKYVVTKNLTFLANYTFERVDWRASVPFHDTEAMSPPAHKFMVGARYSPTDDLHLSTHLYFVDAVTAPWVDMPFWHRKIDPYWRLDLRGEYEFWDDKAALSVGVRNLLDSNHAEGGTLFLNYAEAPRMVFAELRLRIP